MSKAVLISIHPRWCEKIASGKKTIEIRKIRPKLQPPFKCFIYCTMDHPYISVSCGELDKLNYRTNTVGRCNGKVIGEFVCDRIFPIDVYDNGCIKDWNFECMWQACLPYEGIAAYIGREKRGYGWHISNLKIYDTPRELGEFRRVCVNDLYCESCAMYWKNGGNCGNESLRLKRPPQSWCYAEEFR